MSLADTRAELIEGIQENLSVLVNVPPIAKMSMPTAYGSVVVMDSIAFDAQLVVACHRRYREQS